MTDKKLTPDEAYAKGYEARKAGLGPKSNPFKPSLTRRTNYAHWQQGWIDRGIWERKQKESANND